MAEIVARCGGSLSRVVGEAEAGGAADLRFSIMEWSSTADRPVSTASRRLGPRSLTGRAAGTRWEALLPTENDVPIRMRHGVRSTGVRGPESYRHVGPLRSRLHKFG